MEISSDIYEKPGNTAERDMPQLLDIFYNNSVYKFKFRRFAERHMEVTKKSQEEGNIHTDMKYHIVLFLDGKSSIHQNGKWHQAERGTLFISAPGELHCFTPRLGESCQFITIQFILLKNDYEALELSFNEFCYKLCGISLSSITFPVQLSERMTDSIHKTLRDIGNNLLSPNDDKFFYAARRFQAVLHNLMQGVYNKERNSIGDDECPLEKVKDHIEQNYNKPLPVEELCKMAYKSRSHFIRQFKKKYGEPPTTYQQIIRIEKAQTLLSSTEMSSAQIATAVGFENVYYFSKVFKKRMGVPPVKYRKLFRQGFYINN